MSSAKIHNRNLPIWFCLQQGRDLGQAQFCPRDKLHCTWTSSNLCVPYSSCGCLAALFRFKKKKKGWRHRSSDSVGHCDFLRSTVLIRLHNVWLQFPGPGTLALRMLFVSTVSSSSSNTHLRTFSIAPQCGVFLLWFVCPNSECQTEMLWKIFSHSRCFSRFEVSTSLSCQTVERVATDRCPMLQGAVLVASFYLCACSASISNLHVFG